MGNTVPKLDFFLVTVATMSLVGGLYLLNPKIKSALSSGKAIGRVQTVSSIKRRHTGTLVWENIEKNAIVFLKDTLYTPSHSTAELFIGETKTLDIAEDTMLHLDENASATIEITLHHGNVKGYSTNTQIRAYSPVSKRSRIHKRVTLASFPGPYWLENVHEKLSQELKHVLETPSDLSVITALPPFSDMTTTLTLEPVDSMGHDVITNGAAWQKKLPEKIRNMLSEPLLKGVVPVSEPSVFSLGELTDYNLVLLSPSSGTMFRTRRKKTLVRFKWIEIPLKGMSYKLTIYRKEDRRNPLELTTTETAITTSVSDSGHYLWRIRAFYGEHLLSSATKGFVIKAE